MSWTDVATDPDYKVLPPALKRQILQGWYRDNVASDPEYKTLAPDQKFKIIRGHEIEAGLYEETDQPSFVKEVIGGTAKDAYGTLAKAGAGIIKGVTLGAIDPEAGTTGIPFTSIRNQVVPPLSEGLKETFGVSPEIAENPYIQVGPEFASTVVPWGIAAKGVAKVAPLAKVGMAGRVAETAITGGIVGAAKVRDEDESMLTNALVTAGVGAGIHLAIEAAIPVARYIKSVAKYKTVTKDISAEDLFNAFTGREASPEAVNFVKGLSTEERVIIAKEAIKGKGTTVKEQVPRWAKTPPSPPPPPTPTVTQDPLGIRSLALRKTTPTVVSETPKTIEELARSATPETVADKTLSDFKKVESEVKETIAAQPSLVEVEPIQVQSNDIPTLTGAKTIGQGSEIFLEFDGAFRIPNVEELKTIIEKSVPSVQVGITPFKKNIISGARGGINFRIDVLDSLSGAMSSKKAQEVLSFLTGGAEFRGKTSKMIAAQPSLVEVQPKFPETTIKKPYKEGFEMIDEIRAREAEAKQTKMPFEKKPKSKATPKLNTLADFVRSEGGLSTDRMAEAATEAGYFRERPTVSEFIDALQNDVDAKSAGTGQAVHKIENEDAIFEKQLEDYLASDQDKPDIKLYMGVPLKEAWAATNAIMGKAITYLPEKAYSRIPDRIRNKIDEFWKPLSTLTDREQYLSGRYKTQGTIHRVELFAKKMADRLNTFTKEERNQLFQFLDGSMPKEALPENLHSIAVALRTVNKMLGKSLVRRGMLSEETFLTNDNYVRYMYAKHILGDKAQGSGGKLDLNYLKQRKDLTPAEREALGLINDVAVVMPYSAGTVMRDIALTDFFADISKSADVWQPSFVDVPLLRGHTAKGEQPMFTKMSIGRLVEEAGIAEKVAKAAPNQETIQRAQVLNDTLAKAKQAMGDIPEGYIQVPNSKKYGLLAGAFVRTPIARDIISFGSMTPTEISSLVSKIAEVEAKGIRIMKVGKAALNVPTAARNAFSNIPFFHLSGTPLYEIPVYLLKAGLKMQGKTPEYTIALRNGLFKGNWSAAEINESVDIFRKMVEKGSKLNDIYEGFTGLAKYYGKIDDFFKFAKFIEQTEKGVSPDKAVQEAQETFMDYSLAHPSIKMARKHIAPFITFQYKMPPKIYKWIKERPATFAAWLSIPFIIMALSREKLKLDNKEYKKLKNELPLYIKKGQYVLVPYKSPEGNVQWVNLEYFFPWGSYMQMGRDIKEGELAGTLDVVGNPYLNTLYAIKSSRGEDPIQDPYSGNDIYNPLDSPTDKAIKTSEFVALQWLPGMLGWFTQKGAVKYTADAITGKKDRYGRVVTPGQAAGRWVGVNIIAPTKKQMTLSKMKNIKELQSSLFKILKDPTISKEKKEAARLRYREGMKQVMGTVEEASDMVTKETITQRLQDPLGIRSANP